MKLIMTPTSPFARKVRIVLAEKRIECAQVIDSPWEASTRVPDYNPLGMVPVLVLDDEHTLFDSRVIVEYLDTVSPVSQLIPKDGRQRLTVRRWEALADGISDAAAAI
jgi:glutathione S-transferase